MPSVTLRPIPPFPVSGGLSAHTLSNSQATSNEQYSEYKISYTHAKQQMRLDAERGLDVEAETEVLAIAS